MASHDFEVHLCSFFAIPKLKNLKVHQDQYICISPHIARIYFDELHINLNTFMGERIC